MIKILEGDHLTTTEKKGIEACLSFYEAMIQKGGFVGKIGQKTYAIERKEDGTYEVRISCNIFEACLGRKVTKTKKAKIVRTVTKDPENVGNALMTFENIKKSFH